MYAPSYVKHKNWNKPTNLGGGSVEADEGTSPPYLPELDKNPDSLSCGNHTPTLTQAPRC